MNKIKDFLKMKQNFNSIYEVDADTFTYVNQFMYDNDPTCEWLFDKEYLELNGKINKNELMCDVIDRCIHIERTRDVMLGANHRQIKLDEREAKRNKKRKVKQPKDCDTPNLFLVTYTLSDEDKPIALKPKVLKQLKAYRFIYVEEKGSQNGRYHIHCLVQNHKHFSLKKILKNTDDHKGFIHHKPYCYNNDYEGQYLNKENPAKGDIEYITNLVSKLPKSENLGNPLKDNSKY